MASNNSSPTLIRNIWKKNVESEVFSIDVTMHQFPFVAFDMEFPGFLHNTPRTASSERRYDDLRLNVDVLEPIQLGFALFDAGGRIGGAWQVNFCNFDLSIDPHVTASIDLLKKNGVDVEKNKNDGVDSYSFVERFMDTAKNHRDVRFITFHGLYDAAYLLKLATRSAPMPDSVLEFQRKLGRVLGRVYDIKFMARFFSGLLGGELGLDRLAKILGVERVGESHQAGSDSLLTAGVFMKMKQVYKFDERYYEGLMYGMDGRVQRPLQPRFIRLLPVLPHCPQQLYYAPPALGHQYASYGPPVQMMMPRPMICTAPQYFVRL